MLLFCHSIYLSLIVKTRAPAYVHSDASVDTALQAVRASSSIPYISRPASVDNIPCPDGGCCEKIPYRWALDQGFEKIARLAAGGRIFLFILIFIMVFRHFLELLVYACSP